MVKSKKVDYTWIKESGKSIYHGCVVLVYVITEEVYHKQISFRVAKKVGTAVIRNKIKRILKMFIRKALCNFPLGLFVHVHVRGDKNKQNNGKQFLQKHDIVFHLSAILTRLYNQACNMVGEDLLVSPPCSI